MEGNFGGKGKWFPAVIKGVQAGDDIPTAYDLQFDNADGSCLPELKSLPKWLVLYTWRGKHDPDSDEPQTTQDMWHKIAAAYTHERAS